MPYDSAKVIKADRASGINHGEVLGTFTKCRVPNPANCANRIATLNILFQPAFKALCNYFSTKRIQNMVENQIGRYIKYLILLCTEYRDSSVSFILTCSEKVSCQSDQEERWRCVYTRESVVSYIGNTCCFHDKTFSCMEANHLLQNPIVVVVVQPRHTATSAKKKRDRQTKKM